MIYPTMQKVEDANRFQICKWFRFLNSPEKPLDVKIMDRIVERFRELGGTTPEISKQLTDWKLM